MLVLPVSKETVLRVLCLCSFEQGDGGADLARGAVAALEAVVLEEGGLDGVEVVAVREAFDGGDFGSVGRDGEGEAGVDAAAVDEDSAGSALAVVAALLAAGECEVFAQSVEKRGAGVEREGVGYAVDLESHAHHLRSGGGDRLAVFGRSEMRDAGRGGGGEYAGGFDEGAAGEFDVGEGGGLVRKCVVG